MNGPSHYLAAEQRLNVAVEAAAIATDEGRIPTDSELQAIQALLMQAQVHATLAHTASNIATDREHFAAWREVTG